MPSGQFAGDQVIKFVGMARREQRRVASVRSPKPAQCPRRSPSRGCAVGRCALSRDTDNPLRQDLWRAGHAHAGVWLILALVALRYVDEANLSDGMKWLVRGSIPIAAILVPAAFFLSVLAPDATTPNGLIYLAYVGAVLLAVGVLVLGVGLVRRPAQRS